MRPTPAAARYSATGEPNPPVPITSTEAALQLALPFQSNLRDQQVARIA